MLSYLQSSKNFAKHCRNVRPCRPRYASSEPLFATFTYQEPESGMRLGRYIRAPSHFQYDVSDAPVEHKARIHNARELPSQASLDTVGFTMRSRPTAFTDFHNDSRVLQSYYAEMRTLLQETTGAQQVVVFDHVVRQAPIGNAEHVADAVKRVHCDFTGDSASSTLEHIAEEGIYSQKQKRLLRKAEVANLMRQKLVLFNVWRSIGSGPVQRHPLALCDARTVDPSNRLYYEIIYPIYSGREAENYCIRFEEAHKWYYFPDMTPDECIVFRQYSSEGDTQPVFHTALEENPGEEGSQPRQSIEIRAVAFFGNEIDTEDVLHLKARMKNGRVCWRLSPHE